MRHSKAHILTNGSYTSFSTAEFCLCHQSAAVQEWWAHNPHVPTLKLGSNIYKFRMVLITLHYLLMLSIGNPALSCPLEEPSVVVFYTHVSSNSQVVSSIALVNKNFLGVTVTLVFKSTKAMLSAHLFLVMLTIMSVEGNLTLSR
jgi:hypothetical protein